MKTRNVTRGILWALIGGIVFGATTGMNDVNWHVAAAADTLPEVVGHLAFGAVLGLGFGAILSYRTPTPVRIPIDKRR